MTRPVTARVARGILLVLTALLLLSAPAAQVEASGTSSQTQSLDRSVALGADTLDLEEDSRGYSTEYIFGMSKAVRRSTMHPALKPAVWLFTIPVDIVLLPFAALGGLF